MTTTQNPVQKAIDDINAVIETVDPVVNNEIRKTLASIAATMNNISQYGWTVEP